jgi:nitrous oxide reductase accessory protein NosL
MKKHAVVALVVSFAVVGCTRSAEGQMPTPAMISDALPTITDMPGDWRETQRQAFDTRGPENPSIDPSVWCPQAEMVTGNLVELAGDSGADVEMQELDETSVSRLMRLQAWANDDSENYYADAKEAVRICDGTTTTDESGAVTSTAIVEDRDIGDESISWSQTTTPPEGTQKDKMEWISRTTIARFGAIVMVLQLGDASPTGTGTLMSEEDWWSIVEMAGKKLHDLDEQVHT